MGACSFFEVDDFHSYPISKKIETLIKNGNDGSYKSRSEADMAVIIALLKNGRDYDAIKHIFKNYPIGEKYRGHNDPDKYLRFLPVVLFF